MSTTVQNVEVLRSARGGLRAADPFLGFRKLLEQGTQLFFDISTLREPQFTGIPNVGASLAAQILAADLPCQFFIGENVIKRDYVRFLLSCGSGSYFAFHHQLGQATEDGLLHRVNAARRSIGLFPAEKPFHRLFDFEVQVIHDLSTIATPYFHLRATRELHGHALLEDVASNDLNICVSQATAGYLGSLMQLPAERLCVAHNGVLWNEQFRRQFDSLFGAMAMEPFVVILGTIEPRKNLEVVLRALGQDRGLAQRYKYVFLGKAGWLLDFDEAVGRHLGGRLENFLYPGYVSEFKKYCLLRRASFTIYPSLYEGFGLPILESHSLGVPAVFSHSTSMPEVGQGSPYSFDPLEPDDLLAAVYRVEADLADSAAAVRKACLQRAAPFTWRQMLTQILAETTKRIERAAA